MSYVRWGQGGSDLYIYMDVNGFLCCCGCPITPTAPEDWLNDIYDGVEESYYAQSTGEMLAHLDLHSERGDSFPSDIIPRLMADDRENFPPGGVADE